MQPTKKYLNISQHWGSKIGKKLDDGSFVYTNPVADNKRYLTDLKDLKSLIEFHNWSDSGTYYHFTDTMKSSWGMETYQVGSDESLNFLNANYDTSD